MYLLPDQKFAFLAMPATGSVSVGKAIQKVGGILMGGHHDTPVTHWERLNEMGYGPDWTTATTVRDPVTWFQSWFKKGSASPGEDWILDLDWVHRAERDKGWFNHHTRTLYWKFLPYANLVWHQETLQADIDKTVQELGLPVLHLEHRNMGTKRTPVVTAGAVQYIKAKYMSHPYIHTNGQAGATGHG